MSKNHLTAENIRLIHAEQVNIIEKCYNDFFEICIDILNKSAALDMANYQNIRKEIFTVIQNSFESLAETYINLGATESLLNNPKKATTYYEKVLNVVEKLPRIDKNIDLEFETYSYLIESFIDQALEIGSRTPEFIDIINNTINFCENYLKIKDTKVSFKEDILHKLSVFEEVKDDYYEDLQKALEAPDKVLKQMIDEDNQDIVNKLEELDEFNIMGQSIPGNSSDQDLVETLPAYILELM